MSIPTMEQNPNGLHGRYKVEKLNGEPTDPNAMYFVLRLDFGGRDPEHIQACRDAALHYADSILANPKAAHLHQMAKELKKWIWLGQV